ncbi:hypothetical protein [Paramagnetospirillum magnetotacticum]|uniref:hypothetical protein n=1 Tax=Paramagnetospirillum magnetotacticum TaxID=188 RepID=UPI00191C3C24|nr:hypothetical protein [Paramagnetospirillum magnetotacticum]
MGDKAMDAKHTHLNMIQGVVNRLSNNSFLLKGWSVILVSGLVALGAKESKPVFIYIAYFPTLIFWMLDGYFLWQERLFRSLYDRVRVLNPDDIDYSMNTLVVHNSTPPWISAVFSRTLLAFHGAVLITIVVAMLALIKS